MIQNMLMIYWRDTNSFPNKLPKGTKNRTMKEKMICWFVMATASHTQLRVMRNYIAAGQFILCRPPIMKKMSRTNRDIQRNICIAYTFWNCIDDVHILPSKHLIHATDNIPFTQIRMPLPYIWNVILQWNIKK